MNALDENTTKLLTVMESLRAAAYKSFTDRREYEWKFCIALWSALAFVDTALVFGRNGLQTDIPNQTALFWGTAITAVIVIGAHAWWTKGLARASRIDAKKGDEVTDKMCDLLGFQWSDDLKCLFREVARTRGSIFHWAHVVELVITGLLAVIAVVAVAYIRTAP